MNEIVALVIAWAALVAVVTFWALAFAALIKYVWGD